MNKKILTASMLGVLLVLPAVSVTAAYTPYVFNPPSPPPGSSLGTISAIAGVLLNAVWVVAVAYTVVMFIIAGFKFLSAQGNAAKLEEARHAVIWGVVGIAVIILAFSMIFVVSNALNWIT